MANIRIVSDNAVDRATLSASSTAGALAVSNLQTDKKSDVWRAGGVIARLTATWLAAETIACVALPFCNLSPTATMRVRLTNEAQATNRLLYTEHFENSNWQKSAGGTGVTPVVSPYFGAAPDGSLIAARVQFNCGAGGTANDYSLLRQTFSVSAGSTYVNSIYMKANSGSPRVALYYDGSSVAKTAVQLSSTAWTRVASPAQLQNTNGTAAFSFGVIGSGYGTDTSADILVAFAQVEIGSASSSYYPSSDSFTSRSSTATYIGSDGKIYTAAINTARMQYNPGNLSAPAKLLLEAAATNNALYSQDMSNAAAWSTYQATVTANATAAPDGSNSAVRLVNGGANEQSLKGGGAFNFVAGTTYTVSLYAKAGEVSSFAGTLSSAVFAGSGSAVFNLANGTVTSASNGVTASIQYIQNGWYRCSWTFTASSSVSLSTHWINLGMVASDSTKGMYFWGAQHETGLCASSYISTTTAAVTRAADVSSSTAATRPLGYIDSWQSYTYDSGYVSACPAPAKSLRGFTAAQAASAYAYGGGTIARAWLPSTQAVGMAVDITDNNNVQGYIEAARLVAGAYWSPVKNASNIGMSVVDLSQHYRTDAGDLMTDAATAHKTLQLELGMMTAADRAACVGILRNSRAYPILVSGYPGSSDLELERDYTIYGKRSSDSDVALQYAITYSTQIPIESI